MEVSKLIILSASIAILFAFCLGSARSQEVEDEREFDYEIGSEHGPEHWGSIHKEWEACGNGSMQSPIDLSDKKVEVVHELGKLKRTYRPSLATMVNRGHDIMLKWVNGSGGLRLNGTEYTLKQMHWHSPSEHTMNGKKFSLELHMVHESADEKIAVLGILYKTGRPDPLLTEMEEYIHSIKNVEKDEEIAGVVDPRHVRRGSRKYYRYTGSLTTPPCTEGVVWTIVSKVRTVSKDQIRLLRDAVNDHMENNARPKQPTNERTVSYYRPRKAGF